MAFVIYGSLVPLKVVPISFSEALERFAQIQFLDLGIASRADWVANLLLFVPLAYLWLGLLWRPRHVASNLLCTAVVVVLGFALSVGIEFVQVFFPQRTVSINDIVAESIGGVVGAVLWWVTGNRTMAWIGDWFAVRERSGWAEKLLYIYLALMYAYSVLPLDLTLSPVEIFHKWREGRVLLVPFSMSYSSRVDAVYDMVADVAMWIPVSVLWMLTARHSTSAVWLRIVIAASLLELLQLFVYSRVTDVTDVIAAAIGGGVGIVLWRTLGEQRTGRHTLSDVRGEHGGNRARLANSPLYQWSAWLALVAIWGMVIVAVFWYPFEVRIERTFVMDRLQGLMRAPFETYYFGSEYRAITEVLHKVMFFLPGGLLFSWAVFKLPHGGVRVAASIAAGALIMAIAAGIELGQVFMPAKVADPTDWFLETAGGWLGIVLGYQFFSRAQATQAKPPRHAARAEASSRRSRRSAPGARR